MAADLTNELKICVDGLADEAAAAIAERTGFSLIPADEALARPEGTESLILLLSDVDEERLSWGLGACVKACVEVLTIDDRGVDIFLGNLRPEIKLAASVTAFTAHALDLARIFCEALAGRLAMPQERYQPIELAVHEAVVNGLLHGNLEVGPLSKETVEDFISYCQAVESRLADPEYALRRVELEAQWDEDSITVVVVDQGRGYDVDAVSISDDLNRKTGRGLFLIQELSREVKISDRGRRLEMRFAR